MDLPDIYLISCFEHLLNVDFFFFWLGGWLNVAMLVSARIAQLKVSM